MFIPKMSTETLDEGKWYMMVVEGKTPPRRAGYCAGACTGRACEMCGELTTLRARLGRNSELIVLCRRHQSTISLQTLARRRVPAPAAQIA